MFFVLWLAVLRQVLMLCRFVFGVGTDAPIRYSKIMASVKRSFFRRSGVRNADANALSTDPPARLVAANLAAAGRGGGHGAPYYEVIQANRLLTVNRLQLGNRPTGGLDLVPRAGGERVRGDVELDRAEVAVAQHLDLLTLADRARVDKLVDADRAALGEQLGQPGHVDDLVLGAEPVAEALELRQPHVDRHLA